MISNKAKTQVQPIALQIHIIACTSATNESYSKVKFNAASLPRFNALFSSLSSPCLKPPTLSSSVKSKSLLDPTQNKIHQRKVR